MTDQQFDELFEQRLARSLRDLADKGVRPFDAVEITRMAADRAGGRGLRWPSLPPSWRPALLLALLAVALLGAALIGGLIKLPINQIVPNPTFQPFSPPPTAQSSAIVVTTARPSGSLPPATVPPSGEPVGSPTGGSPSPSPTTTFEGTPTPSTSPSQSPGPTPTIEPTASPSPTIAPVGSVIAVTTGDTHACALADDGRVFCWGSNDEGQLGDGTLEYRDYATLPVVGIDDARAIAAGIRFSCAVRSDGSVWCWGEDPAFDPSTTMPRQVPGISDAKDVVAGGAFACALRANGQIACWGVGSVGQLGNGSFESNSGVPDPQAVIGIDDARQISAGWNHACAVRADRSLWCWGGNGDGVRLYGPLGDGTSDLRRSTPAPVPGLSDVAEVQAGGWSTCATLTDGSVWCWGYGERGTLGDGNSANSLVPLQVPGIDDARLLALGDYTGCVSRADESVWCWGDTSWGSATGGPALTPVEGNKSQSLGVTALANDRSCLLIDTRGQAWWWGTGTNQAPQPWPVGP